MSGKVSVAKEKRAALELSIGTIVIVVLAMSMLILGLVLVKNIFQTGTGWVREINNKVKGEIAKLFGQSGKKVVIVGVAGVEKRVEVQAGGEQAGIAIGIETAHGTSIGRDRDKIIIRFTKSTNPAGSGARRCQDVGVEVFDYMNVREGDNINPVEIDGPHAYLIVTFNVPKGVPECSEQIIVDVEDQIDGAQYSTSFVVEIKSKGGLFG